MTLTKQRKLQGALFWALLAYSLDATKVRCPPSIIPCVCEGDRAGTKIKRMSCTDAPLSRSINTDIMLFGSSSKGFPEHNEVVDKLSLIYAGLTSIPAGGFGKIRIFHLDLQGNNFQDRISPKGFAGVGKYLRSLSLAWSNVTAIHPKVFRGMVALRNLSIAENQIREVPGTVFQHLRSLRRLSLAGNPISHLPGTLFRYQTTLELLDLGYCRLRRLPWTLFIGLWNLRVLDLRGNRLSYLESYTFIDLTMLHTLLLSHNPIRRLPTDVFHGLPHLTVLRLDESRIQSVARDAFRDLVELRSLDLGDNAIAFLADGTLALPGLERLHLDGNELTEFPMDVRLMPRLRSLDVSYNRIVTVDRCLYPYLRRLDFFNLQENHLVCDCGLLWLRALRAEMETRWRQKTAGVYHSSVPLLSGRCVAPERLRDVGATSWLDFDCLQTGQYSDLLHSVGGTTGVQLNVTDLLANGGDGCGIRSDLHDKRINHRRRKLRHLAYLSRDLHYMRRSPT
ncbi:hypothetical protein LSH36_32g06000 [Paralvinella palmiformis]|uniref:Uncharacterized protein n=1 Tax=Paralvinella palmiformis TaxID=53620 RepID=A0AAD9KAS6_9ANNE|nr:hypothetical protein LSH36_32g06000 [Paralvinella palmiformis]